MLPHQRVAAAAIAHRRRNAWKLPDDIGRLLPALLAVWIVWGSTYLAIRIMVQHLPVLSSGGLRYLVAGAVLLGVEALRGRTMPTRRQWAESALVGTLLFVGGNGFVAIASTEVASGVVALVCATTPLWAAVFAARQGEHVGFSGWAGVGLGTLGVAMLTTDASFHASPLSLALLLIAPITWALGSIIARRQTPPEGMVGAAAQMVTGGLAVLALGAATGESWPTAFPWQGVAAWLYLAVVGSLLTFPAYLFVIRNAPTPLAMSYAWVNPLIAVVLGAALAGEAFGARTAAASALVIAAVFVAVQSARRTRTPARA